MSSSLVSSLYGGQEAAFQEQMKRQFRENLMKDPVAMQAYQKATGGNTPWYSPSALSAFQNEQSAATRRTNQMARGAQAVRERAIAQGRDVSVSPGGQIQIGEADPYKAIGKYRTLPSGLSVDQVENLPGGFKAVYDREGRLVGTNAPLPEIASDRPDPNNVDKFGNAAMLPMDAIDRAAINRGEGTVAELSRLYPAMEEAVRNQRNYRPPMPVSETMVARPPQTAKELADSLTKNLYAPPASPSTPGDFSLTRFLAPMNPKPAAGILDASERPGAPVPDPFKVAEQELAKEAEEKLFGRTTYRPAYGGFGGEAGAVAAEGTPFMPPLPAPPPLSEEDFSALFGLPPEAQFVRAERQKKRQEEAARNYGGLGGEAGVAAAEETAFMSSTGPTTSPPVGELLPEAAKKLPEQAAEQQKARAGARVAKLQRQAANLQSKLQSGTLTGDELRKAQEDYAKAQSEYLALTLTREQQQELARKALEGGNLDVPGILPRLAALTEAQRLGILDNWRNLISRPLGRFFLGTPQQPDSNETLRYLMEQELLQQAQGR